MTAVVALLAAAACSSKADEPAASEPAPGAPETVRTGDGVTGTTIHLGAITDATGVFASTGKDLALGQQLFWEARNADEKICGTYTVELEVKDHGYNVQAATTHYSEMSGDILALNLLLGSPMATALSEQVIDDGIVAIPLSWAQSISDNPNYAIIGPTYDVEIINGLDYLLEEELIAEGAKIGHVFHDSEYGENASEGVKYFAAEHGMTVVDQRVAPTEADLNSRVIALAAESVDVVVLTTTPPQTAAVAGATVAQGLAVPMVGSGPSYAPALVDTPARDVLLDRFYYSGSNAGLDAEVAAPALELYRAQNPDGKPANSFATGYAGGAVMAQFLEAACAAGDLTREGVLAAKNSLDAVETGGLIGTLDYSAAGISPTRESFVARPDATEPGGSVTVAELYEGPTAQGYERS